MDGILNKGSSNQEKIDKKQKEDFSGFENIKPKDLIKKIKKMLENSSQYSQEDITEIERHLKKRLDYGLPYNQEAKEYKECFESLKAKVKESTRE